MSYGVYWDILTAVQTRIAPASGCPVVVRKKPLILPTDTLPLVVIAPGKEQIKEQTFNKIVIWEYPVIVMYITLNNMNVTTGLNTFLLTRESIRNQLYQVTLPGATTVYDTRIDPEEAIKFSDYLGSEYDVTAWVMWYSSSETRVS